jgi:uncharacterized protein
MLLQLLANKILLVAIISNVIAQTIKIPINYFKCKKWDFSLLFSTGGFPSSHTSTVSALTLRIGTDLGLASPIFALSFIVSIIIMIDASGLRQEVGRHSKTLNDLSQALKMREVIGFNELEELIGHTKLEVLGGLILGLLFGLISLKIPFLV